MKILLSVFFLNSIYFNYAFAHSPLFDSIKLQEQLVSDSSFGSQLAEHFGSSAIVNLALNSNEDRVTITSERGCVVTAYLKRIPHPIESTANGGDPDDVPIFGFRNRKFEKIVREKNEGCINP